MALVVFFICVLDESIGFLLNRIVGQMHEQIVKVALLGTHILLSGKAGNPFLENIESQRFYP